MEKAIKNGKRDT